MVIAAAPSTELSADASEPSSMGYLCAELSAALPDHERLDLLRILRHDYLARSGGELRHLQFGLVIAVIEAVGEVPIGDQYDTARAERRAQGETWPDRTTLADNYGGWRRVVKAAMDQYSIGTPARTPASLDHAHQHVPSYKRHEVRAAIIAFMEKFGAWPMRSEFLEWGVLERRARRHVGRPYPRIPSMKPIRRNYGRFAFALDDAKRVYRIREAALARLCADPS